MAKAQITSSGSPIALAATRAAELRAAKHKAVELHDARRAVQREVSAWANDLERESETRTTGQAERLLEGDGDTIDAVNAELTQNIHSDEFQRRQIEVERAKLPVLDRQIQEAENAVKVGELAHKVAVVPVIADLTTTPLAQARDVVASLREPFIGLLAADLVRLELLGGSYPASDVLPPPAGGIIVSQFIAGLPKHLRPDDLTTEALIKEARKIARPVIAEINGELNG